MKTSLRIATLLMLLTLGRPCFAQADPRVSDGNGVTEWEEWAFTDITWWQTINDQERSQFGTTSGASGAIAVVDPDEWDDIAGPAWDSGGGRSFNSQMISPVIDLTTADTADLTLEFASSWRPENDQTASVELIYDGVVTELFRWTSTGGSNFKEDAPDEFLSFDLPDPGSASELQLAFNMYNAGNDWWWAVDNIGVNSSGSSLFFEDFESVDLGPPIDEDALADDPLIAPLEGRVYSQNGPTGWQVNTEGYVPREALGGQSTYVFDDPDSSNPILLVGDIPHVADPNTITRDIVPGPAPLKLQVDTATGQAVFVPTTDEDVVISSYSIQSASGSLDGESWSETNLDAQEVDALGSAPGESWDTILASAQAVFEGFFTASGDGGSTTIAAGESLWLGDLYDMGVDGQDLLIEFSYDFTDGFGLVSTRTSDVYFLPVEVEYVEFPGLPGDYDDNGVVDAADYVVYRNAFGEEVALPNELASTGVVDQSDLAVWRANHGRVAAASSAVPEPAAMLMAAIALAACGSRRR